MEQNETKKKIYDDKQRTRVDCVVDRTGLNPWLVGLQKTRLTRRQQCNPTICKYNDEKKKKTIIREYDNNHNERQQPATWSSTAC